MTAQQRSDFVEKGYQIVKKLPTVTERYEMIKKVLTKVWTERETQ